MMPANPSVSVIVPVYNGERYLGEALESIRAQRVNDLEIVVVDDGSTDASATVARTHGARVIEAEHGGVARARNLGLSAAGGELIAWLDADDTWTDGALRLRMEYLDTHPAVAYVYGLMDEYIDRDDPPPDWLPATRAEYPIGLLPSVLLRRHACERIGPFEETLDMGEDLDWFSRLQDAGLVGVMLDAVLLRRRVHAGSTRVRHVDSAIPQLKSVIWRSLARKREHPS